MAAVKGYLLALDVSTFCCGFSIWNLNDNKFETAGHIPLKNFNNWLDKVDKVCYILEEIKNNTDAITYVAIEDILQKFIHGKSNIKTIITLAGFNHVIQRKCYEIFNTTPVLYNVLRARNLADCKVPRDTKSKDFILKRVCELHPEIKELLPLMKTRAEFSKESYDVADAVVVARAAAADMIPPIKEKKAKLLEIPEQELLPF